MRHRVTVATCSGVVVVVVVIVVVVWFLRVSRNSDPG